MSYKQLVKAIAAVRVQVEQSKAEMRNLASEDIEAIERLKDVTVGRIQDIVALAKEERMTVEPDPEVIAEFVRLFERNLALARRETTSLPRPVSPRKRDLTP